MDEHREGVAFPPTAMGTAEGQMVRACSDASPPFSGCITEAPVEAKEAGAIRNGPSFAEPHQRHPPVAGRQRPSNQGFCFIALRWPCTRCGQVSDHTFIMG
jgi:hypothetical protein